MKSLVELSEALLHDCGSKCGAPVSKSISTLQRRVKHEGDSFITISLPSFCKHFDRCLDDGFIGPEAFPNFKKVKKGSRIPAFLSEFVSNVFDSEGHLLECPSIDCIRCVRQICLFAKKILRPCTKQRQEAAIDGYLECDKRIDENRDACLGDVPDQLLRYYSHVSNIFIAGSRLKYFKPDSIVPRHGPGATAEGISGNQKYVHRSWTHRLASAGFSFAQQALGLSDQGEILESEVEETIVPHLHPEEERPVRIVLVPKTMKTSRVIAVEPVCMQYIQQGIARYLTSEINTSALTGGRINFVDQTVNQVCARGGSIGAGFATLDLSEASDRVSVTLVERTFKSVPLFLEAVLASRSTRAELPNGTIVPIRKFASMGSALCFPIESLIFFLSIISSICKQKRVFPSPDAVFEAASQVRVYGDDLIVPQTLAPAIADDLESLGFKVNRDKSFWTGKFRESCGEEFYDGNPVRPVYLRRDTPSDRTQTSELISAVSTSNQLFEAGYYRTSLLIRESVEKILGKLPRVNRDCEALGWWEFSELSPPCRYNERYQRCEIRGYVPVTTERHDSIEGRPALVKCLLLLTGKPVTRVDHLDVSVRPYSLALKRKWVPL